MAMPCMLHVTLAQVVVDHVPYRRWVSSQIDEIRHYFASVETAIEKLHHLRKFKRNAMHHDVHSIIKSFISLKPQSFLLQIVLRFDEGPTPQNPLIKQSKAHSQTIEIHIVNLHHQNMVSSPLVVPLQLCLRIYTIYTWSALWWWLLFLNNNS